MVRLLAAAAPSTRPRRRRRRGLGLSTLCCLAAAALLAAAASLSGARADDYRHTYADGEEVTLWVNKVGPYHNPQEIYPYYSIPYCKPEGKAARHKRDGIGAVLEGSDVTDSLIEINFKKPIKFRKICDLNLSPADVQAFTHAVRNHYWYQMYIDELPLWGMVGEFMMAERKDKTGGTAGLKKKGGKAVVEKGFIYTHKELSLSYNGDRIIEVNLTSENPRPIEAGKTTPLTYSVRWTKTDKAFDKRFERYLDYNFFEHQIHWFSIFNSFMMVVFLCGLVALILMRTLKNDYARYTSEDDDLALDRVVDESGWKQVHGDVFRPPPHLVLYAALVGTGHQLIALVFGLIGLAGLGTTYMERGTLVSTALACYALTSFIAGYAGAAFYKRQGGQQWKHAMAAVAGLLPGLVVSVVCLLNTVALIYQSSASLSFYSIVVVVGIWLFVSCPLVVLGTLAGRARSHDLNAAPPKGQASLALLASMNPCGVNTLHRPIPDGMWYTQPTALIAFGGLLPFGSIFIEMYFIFTSFWNYKFYYVYFFMFLVYCILIIVTVCVTIVSTYFLLNAEDYRWWWVSFGTGGSSACYVFLYAVYYFFTKTKMYGLMQTCFYFGYMFLFCVSLFILGGTIGHIASNAFVRRIYQYIKSD